MNEEKDKKDLNYNFGFESQVVQDNKKEDIEMLDDEILEEIDEKNEIAKVENVSQNNNSKTEIVSENNDMENAEILEEIDVKPETNTENNRKIKILGREYNFEDVILLGIGLVLILAIFMMPRIMSIFI